MKSHRGYPAQAGIDRKRGNCRNSPTRLPRAGGDRPGSARQPKRVRWATPRRRGSTRGRDAGGRVDLGYPAQAGIDRSLRPPQRRRFGLPRAGGDRPNTDRVRMAVDWATPRRRGSTPFTESRTLAGSGYPAQAGIDPFVTYVMRRGRGLPRAGGDRPSKPSRESRRSSATPRRRGSTLHGQPAAHRVAGYPAQAGIDPTSPKSRAPWPGRPRAGGDRPVNSTAHPAA